MVEEGGHISSTVGQREVCNFLYAFRSAVVNILYIYRLNTRITKRRVVVVNQPANGVEIAPARQRGFTAWIDVGVALIVSLVKTVLW